MECANVVFKRVHTKKAEVIYTKVCFIGEGGKGFPYSFPIVFGR